MKRHGSIAGCFMESGRLAAARFEFSGFEGTQTMRPSEAQKNRLRGIPGPRAPPECASSVAERAAGPQGGRPRVRRR
eukprot:CAMPEP_0179294438 /NCGR_PEP_ID=MMETSP0797-20121207/43901_1 /TAXON_ID=47934 /ORGANISM="Dinophysis acuminata, Strain DAEP01" /LENGTH=76 /DNA_ID=CAMNT_0021003641 /DNA_START=108 /DNA_END=334 /DNA_ORIENTATION=+